MADRKLLLDICALKAVNKHTYENARSVGKGEGVAALVATFGRDLEEKDFQLQVCNYKLSNPRLEFIRRFISTISKRRYVSSSLSRR